MERYHGSICTGPLEISCVPMFSGPQPVGGGGVPEWVAEVFRKYPDTEMVALQWTKDGQTHSAIYQRMK